jgi:hypothetical protein
MSAWVLIVVLVHADGVHSLQVPFATGPACEAAAYAWRAKRQHSRLWEVETRCHKTDSR